MIAALLSDSEFVAVLRTYELKSKDVLKVCVYLTVKSIINFKMKKFNEKVMVCAIVIQ